MKKITNHYRYYLLSFLICTLLPTWATQQKTTPPLKATIIAIGTLFLKNGHTYTFYKNHTVAITGPFDENLGTHPTNNPYPKTDQSISLEKKDNRSFVLVGGGLKGGCWKCEDITCTTSYNCKHGCKTKKLKNDSNPGVNALAASIEEKLKNNHSNNHTLSKNPATNTPEEAINRTDTHDIPYTNTPPFTSGNNNENAPNQDEEDTKEQDAEDVNLPNDHQASHTQDEQEPAICLEIRQILTQCDSYKKSEIQEALDKLDTIQINQLSSQETTTREAIIQFLQVTRQSFDDLEKILRTAHQKADTTLAYLDRKAKDMQGLETAIEKKLQEANAKLRNSRELIAKKEKEKIDRINHYNTLLTPIRKRVDDLNQKWDNAFRSYASFVFPDQSVLDRLCDPYSQGESKISKRSAEENGSTTYYLSAWDHSLGLEKEIICSKHVYDTCCGYLQTIKECRVQKEKEDKDIVKTEKERDPQISGIEKWIERYTKSDVEPNQKHQQKISREHDNIKQFRQKCSESNDALKTKIRSTKTALQNTLQDLENKPLGDLIEKALRIFHESEKLEPVMVVLNSYRAWGGRFNALKFYSKEAKNNTQAMDAYLTSILPIIPENSLEEDMVDID